MSTGCSQPVQSLVQSPPPRELNVPSMRTVAACTKRQAPHQILTVNFPMSCTGRLPRFESVLGTPRPLTPCRYFPVRRLTEEPPPVSAPWLASPKWSVSYLMSRIFRSASSCAEASAGEVNRCGWSARKRPCSSGLRWRRNHKPD